MQLATKRYFILSTLQAATGGIIAAVVGYLYFAHPSSLQHAGTTVVIGGLGATTLLYYGSIHQFLRRKYEVPTSIILSLISALNILFIITVTGGLDSPYYSLWLLAIVVAGFFGGRATLAVVSATLAYYGYDLMIHQFREGYVISHLPHVAITIATGVIAEWVHLSMGRSIVQHQQMADLSGKLSEEALKAEALMNSVGEGVVVVNRDRQIQLFNPSAFKLTGWDQDSAQGIDYRLVLNLHRPDGNKIDDLSDPFVTCWQDARSIVKSDLTMETKSGQKLAINLSLSPIFGNDHKMTGVIGLFRDISAEKEVLRQKDEFISTASHEMRTPVAAIEGYLSLAMNPAVATIDTRAKGFLDKAHTSTQHLGELFRDLLSITKLEDSGKVAKIEIFDLAKAVEEIVNDMQFSAQKKNLDLHFGPAGDTVRTEHTVMPIYLVKGSPQRMREVVMNLIENAIKFTSEGRVGVTIGGTDDSVTVSVIDSGIGIAPEDASHLFQKFYRIDSTATRTIGGTGLGLYLCRQIVEYMGGKIWIESKLGEGSAFRFTLPRVSASEAEAAASAPAAQAVVPATPGTTAQPAPPVETSAQTAPPPIASPGSLTEPSAPGSSSTQAPSVATPGTEAKAPSTQPASVVAPAPAPTSNGQISAEVK